MSLYEATPRCITKVSNHLKMQKMFNDAVCNNPFALRHVADLFKTVEMCKVRRQRSEYDTH